MPRPILAAPLVLALAAPMPASADTATYALDPEHLLVAFTVMHAGYGKVLGRFADIEGSFVYNEETQELSDVSVTIGAASVDTFHEARNEHVRSPDFLDAAANPQITYTADGGTPTSATTGTVTGDLTIRGTTMPVTLDLTLNKLADYPCCHGKETVGVSATTSLLRSDFGSIYALPDFVGDEVDIMIEFEAIRQE
jgi:polyisoprenoid-binding protein YceI